MTFIFNLLAPIQLKWILKTMLIGVGIYYLLFTKVWGIVYGLFLIAIMPNATGKELTESFLCKPGDWVLDTFQPMVSDKSMIDNYEKNKELMEKIALITANRLTADNNGVKPEFKELLKNANLLGAGNSFSWSVRPYDAQFIKEQEEKDAACYAHTTKVERNKCHRLPLSVVVLEPNFGKTYSQYFCNMAKNSFKQYYYFPEVPPKIDNGKLLGMVYNVNNPPPLLGEVVVNIDKNHQTNVFRRINDHWFIGRN